MTIFRFLRRWLSLASQNMWKPSYITLLYFTELLEKVWIWRKLQRMLLISYSYFFGKAIRQSQRIAIIQHNIKHTTYKDYRYTLWNIQRWQTLKAKVHVLGITALHFLERSSTDSFKSLRLYWSWTVRLYIYSHYWYSGHFQLSSHRRNN